MSLCIQDRLYIRNRALCREGFSQLQSGRTSVDWHWPGKQLHRISFEWIYLQSDAPRKEIYFKGSHRFQRRLNPGCSWTLCGLLQEISMCLGDVWRPKKWSDRSVRKKQNMPTCSVIHKRLIALFKFNLTSIFVVCHTPLFSHSCLEKLFLLFWKSGLMEFALKSIILCGTFGLKTDSAAWLVSIKCF